MLVLIVEGEGPALVVAGLGRHRFGHPQILVKEKICQMIYCGAIYSHNYLDIINLRADVSYFLPASEK